MASSPPPIDTIVNARIASTAAPRDAGKAPVVEAVPNLPETEFETPSDAGDDALSPFDVATYVPQVHTIERGGSLQYRPSLSDISPEVLHREPVQHFGFTNVKLPLYRQFSYVIALIPLCILLGKQEAARMGELSPVQPLMVTSVGKEEHRVVSNHPKESRSSRPDSIGEEPSDSEDELLEVLEGVVSSNQEGRVLTPGIKTATSPSKVHSEIKSSLANDPPDPLDIGVSKVAAELVSKGSAGFNKFLSKSAKKRLKKQAKEESLCSSSNGGNLTIPPSLE
ncbi:hypothetical protein RHSIM_Rhsim11G0000500 [Rhododendron simsii]|uniref:Uncharacterized protein n=1 Tax=Rhododendron simsii TaxID=118357 RepID=A0A834LB55_RHOSS|nr:hypothetical protein RHSIM_Rhsim11G0000500 [Rhododendron simsii]